MNFLLFLGALLSSVVFADLREGNCGEGQKAKVTTAHTETINGKQISYDATAGFLEITAADGKSKACIFYTSYTVKNITNSSRPITFAFNGGPGAASLWLHMGALGPKRVDMGADGLTVYTPFRMVENNSSLLEVTDIVTIDPVATGFSSPEADATRDKFFGVKNDYKSVAEFIRNYLDSYNRWDSPKFVMGESYGGIRGSLLAHHLQADMGIYLNGLILVSPWLSTTTTNFGESNNDVPYVTFFPTFATTAWYHKKIGANFQSMALKDVLRSSEEFARGRYAAALSLGNDLSEKEFHEVAGLVSQYTGIPQSKVEDLNLRLADTDYFVGLMNAENKVVGRFDSRFVGGRLTSTANPSDPSDTATSGPFTAAINFYLRNDLNFQSDTPYVTGADATPWPMDSDGQEYGVVDDLSQALIDNPSLRLYVASGFYDLACPYETVRYSLERLAPRLNLKDRVTHSLYPAGHMMYINPVALTQFRAEIGAFITK